MKKSFWSRWKNQSPLVDPSLIDQATTESQDEEERIERAKLILDFSDRKSVVLIDKYDDRHII